MEKKEIVVIFIKNSKGEFFIHQRLATKKTFPNRYGLGAGGHVDEGEDKEVAAKRELLEETGLATPVEYLFSEDFETPEIFQTVHLFITHTDEPIETDQSEWQWSGWKTKEEINVLSAEEKLCTDTNVLYKKFVSGIQA